VHRHDRRRGPIRTEPARASRDERRPRRATPAPVRPGRIGSWCSV
jgi:hypothetical protein